MGYCIIRCVVRYLSISRRAVTWKSSYEQRSTFSAVSANGNKDSILYDKDVVMVITVF
jgi:hypothetical protein